MLVLLALSGCGSCGGSCATPEPAPPAVEARPAAPTEAMPKPVTRMPDMGEPAVPLEASLVSVEPGAAGDQLSVVVDKAGLQLNVTVYGSPICGGEGLTLAAQRNNLQIELTATGGAPCAAGQTGKLTIKTKDQPTNVRGEEVVVKFPSATGAPTAGPAPIR